MIGKILCVTIGLLIEALALVILNDANATAIPSLANYIALVFGAAGALFIVSSILIPENN